MALDYPRQPFPVTGKGMMDFSSVTITCEAAPSTPYTIQSRGTETGTWDTQWMIPNSSATPVTTISTTGIFDGPGNREYRLTGGTGGTFTISGNI